MCPELEKQREQLIQEVIILRNQLDKSLELLSRSKELLKKHLLPFDQTPEEDICIEIDEFMYEINQ
jgi:hypothetical protein